MKQFIHRYLPDPHQLRSHKNLRFLGDLLHDPRLWHFSRRSTVRGLAAGMFFAFVPVPWQMLLAATAAALLRFNMPVAVAMVWITNPVTIPPIFFACYQFGAWLLGTPPLDWAYEPSLDWFLKRAGDLGWPLLVGSLTIGVVASTTTFVIADLLWRRHIINKFRRRRVVAVSG
jgi:hypothetical protein